MWYKKDIIYIFSTMMFFVPQVVLGAKTISAFIASVTDLANSLVPLLFGFALLFFLFGIVVFVFNETAEGEKSREKAKERILWGVVVLFVLVSVWGIVSVLGAMFGVSPVQSCVPTQIGATGVSSCVTTPAGGGGRRD